MSSQDFVTGNVTIDDGLAELISENPDAQIGQIFDPVTQQLKWVVLPLGGKSFHHMVEAETTYTIPDGSDYFVLADDYDHTIILPTASAGCTIQAVCTHVPRFGGGHVDIRRPDSAVINSDDASSVKVRIGPLASVTLVSNGVDWWIVASYGTVTLLSS